MRENADFHCKFQHFDIDYNTTFCRLKDFLALIDKCQCIDKARLPGTVIGGTVVAPTKNER